MVFLRHRGTAADVGTGDEPLVPAAAPAAPWTDHPSGEGPVVPVLPSLGEAAGFALARVFVVDVLAVTALRVTGLPPVPAWAVLAVAMVWSLTPGARPVTAAVAAAITWLLGTGFVTNRLGVLTFTATDRDHVAVVLLAGLVALLVSARARTAARDAAGPRHPDGEAVR